MRSSKRTIRRRRRVNRFHRLPVFLLCCVNSWISFNYKCMSWFLRLQLQNSRWIIVQQNFPICNWSCKMGPNSTKSTIFRNWRNGGNTLHGWFWIKGGIFRVFEVKWKRQLSATVQYSLFYTRNWKIFKQII